MAQVLIRQLDERVVKTLRARARSRGVSLKQSLRELLTAAAHQHGDGRHLAVDALIREAREQR